MTDWRSLFAGQTVFLVAGGSSLWDFQWHRLEGRNLCAINRAYETCPGAQMLYWSDAIFWHGTRIGSTQKHSEAITAHAAEFKATLDLGYQPGALPPEVVLFTRADEEVRAGFDPDPTRVYTFNNSAGAAMHILAHMRPSRIVLLGLDMRHIGGRTHWHAGHGRYIAEETLTERMLPHFAALRAPMADRGIEVLNASPESAVEVWPKITIEEAMLL